MSFPKKFARITKHKKPRCQIYQPGFNDRNSCWLEGQWLTLPNDEWEARKDEHVAMYEEARKTAGVQCSQNPGTPVEKMTPAQRQAWEYYSGNTSIHGRDESGATICFYVELRGGKMGQDQIEHLRANDIKVFDKVTTQTDDPESIGEQLGMPDDLLIEEPHDPWEDIIAENRKRSFDMSAGIAEGLATGEGAAMCGGDSHVMGLMAGVAMHGLLEIEEEIIRGELEPGKDRYHDPEEAKARYVKLHATLKQQFGEHFDALYAQNKATENSCARHNLDNSNRYLYSYVLPEFHDDGSHEPWGENDVPLTGKERKGA